MNQNFIHDNQQIIYQQSKILDFFTFICPALIFVEIKLIGRIFLPEILLLLILFILIPKKGYLLLQKWPRMVFILGLIWLIAQIVTDLIRSTPFEDFSRGWAKIIFLLLNFSTLYLLLVNNVKRIVLFTAGLTIGLLLNYLINPSEFALLYPWKFGISWPVMFMVILIAQWLHTIRFAKLSLFLIFALGLFSIYMGSRAQGGLLVFSAIYLYLHSKQNLRLWIKHRLSLGRILVLIILTSLSLWSIATVYSIAARSGWLGEIAKTKYYQQATGDYGLLLGGRVEIIVSSRAIMDSPLIGHGSWAKNPEYRLLLLSLRDKGYNISEYAIEKNDLIPTHSHLFGAWVEAGILGALFWSWLLILVLRLLYDLFRLKHNLLPLFVISAMFALWDILFSPFGATERLQWGFSLTLFFTAMQFIHYQKPSQPRFAIQ